MVLDDPFNHSKSPQTSERPPRKPFASSHASLRYFLASPMDRAAAWIVDGLILFPIGSVVVAPLRSHFSEANLIGDGARQAVSLILLSLLFMTFVWIYQTFCISRWGATPGKMFFRLRVVSIWDGKFPRFRSAGVRSLIWCLEPFLCLIPFLAVLANRHRRPMHDRLADTIVITDPHRSVNSPDLREVAVIHGAVAAVVAILVLVFSLSLYDIYQEGGVARFQGGNFADSSGLCEDLTELAGYSVQREGKDSRLQVAMALFAAGLIDSECLDMEAEFAMGRDGDSEENYLAKALSLMEFTDLSLEYSNEACIANPTGVSCSLGQLNRLIDLRKWEEVSKIFSRVYPQAPAFLQVWSLRHYMLMKEYDKAYLSLQGLSEKTFLREFVGQHRVKILWYLGRREEAEIAAISSLENFSDADRFGVARWFCTELLNESCKSKDKPFCQLVARSVQESSLSLRDEEIGATYLQMLSCGDGEEEDWQRVGQAISSSVGHSMIDAILLQKAGKLVESRNVLKPIIEKFKDTDKHYWLLAVRKWIETSDSVGSLQHIRSRWLAMDRTDAEWFSLGESLVRREMDLGDWENAFSTVSRLLKSVPQNTSLKKILVVSSYHSGRRQVAEQTWKELAGTDFRWVGTNRAPASQDPYLEVQIALAQKEASK